MIKTVKVKLKTKSLADILFPDAPIDESLSVLDIPPDRRRLHTETYDFTVTTILSHLDTGHIFIPTFQRGYVWKRPQASRLIESLLIQCPIPVLYLSQTQDEKLAVVDGNQRLTSIKLYLKDEYPLKGLTAYPELEGLKFSQLDPRFRRHINNRTLRCIVILKETHPQVKFDVFERLNTGAVQLQPQELRHGLYQGDMISLIGELSKDHLWRKLTAVHDDKRMKGEELLLRFFALHDNLAKYTKPMTSFLNAYAEANRKIDPKRTAELKARFFQTIGSVDRILGDAAFRLVHSDGSRSSNVNSALFDAQMVAVAKVGIDLNKVDERVLAKFSQANNAMLKKADFLKSITAATSDPPSVKSRIDTYTDIVREVFHGILKK